MRKTIIYILLMFTIIHLVMSPALAATFFEADDGSVEELTVQASGADSGALEERSLFPDVTIEDWFYTYASDLSEKGVVSGYPDGTFGPDRYVSCGEALKLILLAAGYDERAAVGSNWASGYLKLAISYGFINKTDISDLDDSISRLLIAKIAAKALDLVDLGTTTPFADTSNTYVLSLFQHDIIEGINENSALVYKPDACISRAEISAIVWRICNLDIRANQIRCGSEWVDILDNVPVVSYNTSCFNTADGIMRYDAEGVETSIGVDVSSHQGEIDWQKVKASGIDYAMIRLGFRGYSLGGMNLDSYFDQNIRGALEAGLKVGVYYFSQAITVEEAQEEAAFVLSYINGYDISYPVVYDWENINTDTARTNGLDAETLSQCASAFCDMIKSAGYTPMIYFNTYIAYMKYDLSKILAYDFWLAEYSETPVFYYNFQMWQYTSSGKVAGITGAVDMNICLMNY